MTGLVALVTALSFFANSEPVDIPECDCTQMDSCMVLCPAGDIPFNVFLYTDAACETPLVGFDCIRISFPYSEPYVAPCPNDPDWPYIYPDGPSNSEGQLVFNPKILGCAPGGEVLLQICGCMDIEIPCAKSLDVDQNGEVDAHDVALCDSLMGSTYCCLDFDCDGIVDTDDRDLMLEHLLHSCTGTPTCVPALVSPVNGAVDIPLEVTLDWYNVSGGEEYQVQIGESCGAGDTYTVAGSEKTVTGLSRDTWYHWRVRAKCGGYWRTWTNCRTFRTVPCGVALLTPDNGASCLPTEVTLDWDDLPGATAYEVQYGSDCGSGSTHTTASSSFEATGLATGVEHHWRVRAECDAVWGSWTDCRTFSTAPSPPSVPVPISPLEGENGLPTAVLLEWGCVPGAIGYDVLWGEECGSGTTVSSDSCYKEIDELEADTGYCWKVRARGACGTVGDWSACNCFHTAVPPNSNAKWALHYAGPHNAKANTCAFEITDCEDVIVNAPSAPGRYDVYVMAVDVDGVAGTRYGLMCDGPFYFYGWTKCSDFEIPTAGWPGCGEANAQTWTAEQAGPHVTVGILDLYIYGSSSLGTGADSRVGFAEWCDGSQPSPKCFQTNDPESFCTLGFGEPGELYCDPPVPVALAGFKAEPTSEGILLRWEAGAGAGFDGFYVCRSAGGRDGDYLRLHEEAIAAGSSGAAYCSYLDEDVTPGTLYYYKIEAVERDGGGVFFGPYPAVAVERTAAYRLSQNVPNPFSRRGSTTIHFILGEDSDVKIRVLDAAGRLVRTLDQRGQRGDNWVMWNAKDRNGRRVAAGIYFYEIRAPGFSAERKMLVVD
jgi:hypothetical protein